MTRQYCRVKSKKNKVYGKRYKIKEKNKKMERLVRVPFLKNFTSD